MNGCEQVMQLSLFGRSNGFVVMQRLHTDIRSSESEYGRDLRPKHARSIWGCHIAVLIFIISWWLAFFGTLS